MKFLFLSTRIFLLLLALATLNIALQAIADPQTIMDQVGVTLGNITARNSVRALYGGVNLFFAIYWMYTAFARPTEGLRLALLFTGGFAFGRVLGIALDGMPGVFALKWLAVESVFGLIAGALLWIGAGSRDANLGSRDAI